MQPTSPASPMTRRSPLLNQIKIATPCEASWGEMRGDDRMRFCNHCALNVYNLSAMTTEEAEALLMKTEGRLCVRLYQRADGTVITEDCPKGLERVRRRLKIIAGAVASALAVLTGLDLMRPTTCEPTMGDAPVPAPSVRYAPPKEAHPRAKMGEAIAPRMIMGGIGAPQKREIMGKVALPRTLE